ncbi:unnamed protein product [Leuciscus chuanchicus]
MGEDPLEGKSGASSRGSLCYRSGDEQSSTRGWSVVGPRASVLLNADRPPSPAAPRRSEVLGVLLRGCRCFKTTAARARGSHPPRSADAVVVVRGGTPLGRRPASRLNPGTAASKPQLRPQIRRDDPLNLSILLSGGKETNKDSLSSGERRGKSPAPNPRPLSRGEGIVAYGRPLSRRGPGV